MVTVWPAVAFAVTVSEPVAAVPLPDPAAPPESEAAPKVPHVAAVAMLLPTVPAWAAVRVRVLDPAVAVTEALAVVPEL